MSFVRLIGYTMPQMSTVVGTFESLYMHKRHAVWFVLPAIVVLLGLNLGLKNLNSALSMPFFFDSIGTAIAAALFGLLPGLAVGVLTNGVQEALAGFTMENLPWAICSASTAIIVWAYARSNRFSDIRGAAFASLWVALANSILGAAIATFLYGGMTGVPLDYVAMGIVTAGRTVLEAAFLARLPSNLIDKGIAVFLAYLAFRRFARKPLDIPTGNGTSSLSDLIGERDWRGGGNFHS